MSGYLGNPLTYEAYVKGMKGMSDFIARQTALDAWRRGKPPGDQSVPGGNRAQRRADAARAGKRP